MVERGELPSLPGGEEALQPKTGHTHTPGASLEYPISLMCVFLLGGKSEEAEGEHANNVELEWNQEPSCFKGLLRHQSSHSAVSSDAAESLDHLGGWKVVPIA